MDAAIHDPFDGAIIVPAPGHGERRDAWRTRRADMENSGNLRSAAGERSSFIFLRRRLFGYFDMGSWPFPAGPLHRYLMARSCRLRVKRHDVAIRNLPDEFAGYSILHLSDLHFGGVEGIEDALIATVAGMEADLLVFTGDFLDPFDAPPEDMVEPLRRLLDVVSVSDGIFAVLGNHDRWRSVDVLESLGIRVLVNESAFVRRARSSIVFTGTDDPGCFYTEDARRALGQSLEGCRIALCHTPELADVAADNGFALYLAGHTHGGQICLPGGRALITDLQSFPEFYEGQWSLRAMVGYTSVGVGASIVPYRLFKPGEVATLVLHRRDGEIVEG